MSQGTKLLPLPAGKSPDEWGGRDTGPCLYEVDDMEAFARANMAPLLAENERLRAELSEKVMSDTALKELRITPGEMFVEFEGGASQLLAECFADQFSSSGGSNYVELKFTHKDGTQMAVTIQRIDGLSPADKARQAEARAERLAEALRIAGHDLEQGIDQRIVTAHIRAALDQEGGNG